MPHDVIMPALGMAQDTGLIVSWLKRPGDPVKKGEALFEVETDKATMEVEAQDDGFLSAVTVSAGSDVPVGQVIARIVSTEAEVEGPAAGAEPPTTASGPDAIPPPAPRPEPERPRASATATRAVAPVSAAGSRILVSPKARRVAAERGLDLSRLVAAGYPQPYHMADLARIGGASTGARSLLTARAAANALDALLGKAAPDTDRAALFSAFARGAWRAAMGESELAVTILRLDGSREGGGDGSQLSLLDLTSTRLVGFAGEGSGLSLSLARDGGAFTLTLAFAEAELPFASAVLWLEELAARIEDPVRQLV